MTRGRKRVQISAGLKSTRSLGDTVLMTSGGEDANSVAWRQEHWVGGWVGAAPGVTERPAEQPGPTKFCTVVFQWQAAEELSPAAGGFHSAQNWPEKMRTGVVALLHDPKPSSSLAGFSRIASAASAPPQSSTVDVQLAASGPEMVQEAARAASEGVLAVGSKETLTPAGGVGRVTHPWVSYAPVVVLKNWQTSPPGAVEGGSVKVMGVVSPLGW